MLSSLTKPGGFNDANFRELFYPLTVAAAALLVVAIVFYNVQVRRFHRHPPLLALQEWLLWTALCVFGLLLIEAIFHFYFFVVLLTIVIGLATFVWVRFFYFPPQISVYNAQLRRARSLSQVKYRTADATLRTRKSSGRQRRRRR